MDDIIISVASDTEARACLALLPEVKGVQEFLIARAAGELAGAAALNWQSWATPPGFPLWIRVVPDRRRRGLGRRLLARAAELAVEETDGLWSLQPAVEDSEAARFMRACGFRGQRRQRFFQGRTDALLANIAPLLERLDRRAGGRSEMRIVGLEDAPLEELGWLVSAELGGGPARATALIRRQVSGSLDRRDRSQVAMVGDEVAGVILWRVDEDGVAAVEGRVAAPRWRGGPTNLRLLEAGLRRCEAEGVAEIRFHCEDSVGDTLSLARRAQAVEGPPMDDYYLPLVTPPPPPALVRS